MRSRVRSIGSFALTGMPPGRYVLRVAPEEFASRGLSGAHRPVEIVPAGTILDGHDLVMTEVAGRR